MFFDTVLDYYDIPSIHTQQVFYILKEYSPRDVEDIKFHLEEIRRCELLTEKKESITCLSESLDWLDQKLQQHFFRAPGVERQMVADIPFELKQKLAPILNHDFGDSINLDADPHKIILYGASEAAMGKRIDVLQKVLEKKSEKERSLVEVYVLVGARDLWPIDEKMTEVLLIERLTQIGKTTSEAKIIVDKEFTKFFGSSAIRSASTKSLKTQEVQKARVEIVQYFLNEYQIKWPIETDMAKEKISSNPFFKSLNIHFFDAPKEPNGERPNTKSTLAYWWKEYGEKLQQEQKKNGNMSIYTISSQPDAIYQLQQAKIFAFQNQLVGFEFEVIASRANLMEEKHCTTALNNLAKIISFGKEIVKKRMQEANQN